MIIYTCITNGYDVPEGHYIDPDVRYVLLHDGSVSVPDGWEGIDVRETFKCDEPVRQSYYPKINPHKFFDKGEDTVWLDGGCLLYTSPSPRDLTTSRMPSSA